MPRLRPSAAGLLGLVLLAGCANTSAVGGTDAPASTSAVPASSPAAIRDPQASVGEFVRLAETLGLPAFARGWVWLAGKRGGEVQILSSPNQDNPMSQGLFPIFGNDVWEHAYYLKYNNRRPEYLAAWWNVVNWDEINKRYESMKSGQLEPALAR